MSGAHLWHASFLATIGQPAASLLERDPDLAATLDDLHRSATAAWPHIHLAPELFGRALGRRCPADLATAAQVAELRAADVYVCVAAVAGDPVAIREVDERYIAGCAAALVALRPTAEELNEVQQRLRVLLLVRTEDKAGRLDAYGGRGALGAWVRVCAVRELVHLRQRGARPAANVDLDQALAGAPAPELDGEATATLLRNRALFRQAVRDAVMQLAPAERGLLAQHYLDRLTLEQLAALHQAHRATIARRIARARDAVMTATQSRLRDEGRLSESECDSVLRAGQLDVDTTIVRALRN
jgi:RNA polymerase sigma-70 factor (ECF subfamily)